MVYEDSANVLLQAYVEKKTDILQRIGQQKYDENLKQLNILNIKE